MVGNKNKFFSIFLLLLFLYAAVGYYPVFLLKQNFIRTEIKQKIKKSIPESELTLFSFNQKDFMEINWVKKNKEFLLGNNLYDIVKLGSRGDGTILLYCINDEQEKKLFVSLEDLVSKNSSADKNLQKAFKLLSAFVTGELEEAAFEVTPEQKHLTTFLLIINSFKGKIPTPPPEIS